jgi:hypothetical protein
VAERCLNNFAVPNARGRRRRGAMADQDRCLGCDRPIPSGWYWCRWCLREVKRIGITNETAFKALWWASNQRRKARRTEQRKERKRG